jgi:CRISPR-associated endonuclease/helicase Cas3
MNEYSPFFERITGNATPHAWQLALGEDEVCRDRTIRIPTGFGKTAGVVVAWLHHRVARNDNRWPRRLVFCLPMRVLVEQTERTVKDWLTRAGADVDLHVLMGGVKANRWVDDLDKPAILIGTQDMLLSRALNRGYASGRALWPMEYGLLHQDALWVLDEVQLMDVGLATSAQLAAFRDEDLAKGRLRIRPVHTWWMSATLQTGWLRTVDHPAPSEPPLSIPSGQRKGGLFEVRKNLVRAPEVADAKMIAACARERHVQGSLTLVVVNRVRKAVEVYDALEQAFSESTGKKKERRKDAPDLRLVHSRFRGAERACWARDFLRRDAPVEGAGRIIVATQVVEAGVDISARTLVTDLAPWPSLVQRFGRAARYAGESSTVVVAGAVPGDEKESAPYRPNELSAANEAIARLLGREGDASPRSLEAFEEEIAKTDPEFLARLYPYEPLHVLRRRDLDDLFDTSADLSGADLDVSRFIRSGEDRDVTVFWRAVMREREVQLDVPPRREELCPVPIGDIREWKHDAYVLDYLDGTWTEREAKRLVPGMTVLLNAADGGYTSARGWDGKAKPVEIVPPFPDPRKGDDTLGTASSSEGDDGLSVAAWKRIATHGREAADVAGALCATLQIPAAITRVLVLAARWHDVGKAHETFQDAIKNRTGVALGERRDLAKAPRDAWRRPPYPDRPGFRHELASTLAIFELLRQADPFHQALLGPHRELLAAIGTPVDVPSARIDHPLAKEIAALSADDFDLLAWLVCTHHGKVRCVWTSTPHDQERGGGGIHGVWENDQLPAFALTNAQGEELDVPLLALSLSAASMGIGARYGASWGERAAGLLQRHGPFTLTFLESVIRVADWRASRLETEDPLA